MVFSVFALTDWDNQKPGNCYNLLAASLQFHLRAYSAIALRVSNKVLSIFRW